MSARQSLLPFAFLFAACGGQATSSSPDVVPARVAPDPGEVRGPTQPPAATPPEAPPQETGLSVVGSVNTVLTEDGHRAEVELVVTDERGRPVAGIEVVGRFTDGIEQAAVLTTGEDGVARTTVKGGGEHMRVGFRVMSTARLSGQERAPVKARVGEIYPSPCCPSRQPPAE